MPRPLRIQAAGETHVGRQREHNEDSFAVDLDLGLFLVADGIGGAASGEVASQMAVELIQSICRDGDIEITQPNGFDEHSKPHTLRLVSCIWRSNEQIYEAAQRDLRYRGMGTTVAALYAVGGAVHIAHVGDSRVYRYRRKRLERLTEDHSLWNEHIQRGEHLPDDIDPLVARNVVTRALGMSRTVDVDTRVERPLDGDLFLICSDGLTGPVSDPEIVDVLARPGDLTEKAQALIDLANDHGGPDNVTCVLVRLSAAG